MFTIIISAALVVIMPCKEAVRINNILAAIMFQTVIQEFYMHFC